MLSEHDLSGLGRDELLVIIKKQNAKIEELEKYGHQAEIQCPTPKACQVDYSLSIGVIKLPDTDKIEKWTRECRVKPEHEEVKVEVK